MNRTVLGVGAVAALLLLFGTGAKAQEDEQEQEGGYGKLPPNPPPEDPRGAPALPGVSGGPKKQPSGSNIIPTTPTEPGAAPVIKDDDFYVGSSDHPYAALDLVRAQDPEEYAEGSLIVYWPNTVEGSNINAELAVENWAQLYGYQMVHHVYETPENMAYTAQVWYRGNERGTYDLEQSYSRDYLENAITAGGLSDMFVAGLIDWLHGPQ